MAYIPKSVWAKYKNIINRFHEDAFNDILTWSPIQETIPVFGEDEAHLGASINIKCLFLYNYFRTWPIIGYTITGEVDKQSCVAIMNIANLKAEYPHLISSDNKLVYKPDKDLFIHRGDTYIATGDTFIAQADDEPLLFMIILKRFLNHQK